MPLCADIAGPPGLRQLRGISRKIRTEFLFDTAARERHLALHKLLNSRPTQAGPAASACQSSELVDVRAMIKDAIKRARNVDLEKLEAEMEEEGNRVARKMHKILD